MDSRTGESRAPLAGICRSCGRPGLPSVLSLGAMPLANALLTRDMLGEPEPVFPLEVVFCESCALLQLKETVPPEGLFRQYTYLSSFSDTMLKHAHESARALIASGGLSADSLVIEIASNDGYMLSAFASEGIPVLGIDPARNVASVAEAKGVPTLVEFFTESLARDVRRQRGAADLILANNVLAHVPEISDVLRGVRVLLKDDGVLVLETPYVRDLVEKLEFDTIYHEHVFYYSMAAMAALLRRADLTPLSVTRIPIHGGSIRVTAGVSGRGKPDGSVDRLLSEEEQAGMSHLPFYRAFAQRVPLIGEQLTTLLQQIKSSGWTAAGYGAAAKGSTLLNHFGIGKEMLDYIVDRSTVKQGLYMPGVHLPICPTERLLESRPDFVLLLTWNFAAEILQQQSAYRAGGGKFILPLPEVKIV